MIESLIEYSCRNKLLGHCGLPGADGRRHLGDEPHPRRCHPGSFREPGHRLYRLDGPQPQGDRGPDHLPALGEPAGPGRGQGRALLLRIQFLDDQHHLRRLGRLLFRPHARAGAAGPGQYLPAVGAWSLISPPTRPRWVRSSGTRSRATTRTWGTLRGIQDWYVRYQLNSVPGVAQVGSVGGFPREYQVDVTPEKLACL